MNARVFSWQAAGRLYWILLPEIPRSRPLESQNSREFGNIVPGDFTPVLAKHTKSFNLVDTLSVGVDRIQRNFEPLQRQVETWRKTQVTDETAKLIFYSAFIDGKLEAPRSLLAEVHWLYFEPQYPEFSARTMWSLSNAFTSAFKKLDPVPQFKATANARKALADHHGRRAERGGNQGQCHPAFAT